VGTWLLVANPNNAAVGFFASVSCSLLSSGLVVVPPINVVHPLVPSVAKPF